ncbi:MAG: response regulator [Deltaproteobacteria bacterium]|nr:MAG: response regulator [Deltaproteobacteria bacterium]
MHIVRFVKTVLIIEDDRDTRAILSEILAGEGYEAVAVDAGDSAITYLGSHDPPCLVLLDLRLPRMNGIAFLQWLNKQEQLRKLPVAVLSALRVDTEKDKEPFRDHVVAVLRKPFTLEDVLELIESHCGTLPGTQEAA